MDRQNLLPKFVDVVPMDIDDDNIRHVITQEITEFRSVHKDFSPAKSPAFHPKLEGAAPEFSPSSQHEYRPDEMDVDFDDFIQVVESHDIASSGFGLTVEHGENINETVGIVVDTNWLLSHGGWLHELLGLLSTYQLSRVYVCVPWICLAELDGIQKSNKRSTGGISAIARKAIKWLYALFRRKTTGLKGQKISECISAELQVCFVIPVFRNPATASEICILTELSTLSVMTTKYLITVVICRLIIGELFYYQKTTISVSRLSCMGSIRCRKLMMRHQVFYTKLLEIM